VAEASRATAAAEVASDPWPLRWAQLPTPIIVGAGALLAIGGLVAMASTGSSRPLTRVFVLMIAAYAVAIPLLIRGGLASLARLPGALPRREEFRRELGRLPLRWWGIASFCGMGMHASIVLFLGLTLFPPVSETSPVMIVGWLHGAAIGLLSAFQLRQGWLFLRLGRALPEVDLLDPSGLAPFVQVALRLVLVSALILAVMLPSHLDWQALRLASQMVLMLPVALAIPLLLFAFPLWGIHERMRDERSAELSRVNAAIRGERDALAETLLAADADRVTTVDLLQYRSQVEEFPTWPFGTPALVRLLLYAGIPVAGWIGGALVERGLDRVLSG
jgi:hypothetical protein